MTNLNDRLYISTIASDDIELARRYSLGLEIAEFCTAYNMDEAFSQNDRKVKEKLLKSDRFIFHVPFSELSPAAIDPLIKEVTIKRYRQATDIARNYGIKRLVIHSGYVPRVYHKTWMKERSVEFWKKYLERFPEDMEIYLENVFEDSPELLTDIAREVNDPRFRLCLDVGHASTEVSKVPVLEWIDCFSERLSHVHLHNNDGDADKHWPLSEGTVPMAEVLSRIIELCPNATYTIENICAAPSVQWLIDNGYIKE